VTFEYDDDFKLVEEDHVFDALVRAGRISGLGDNRPSNPNGNPGPYGRFRVERL
jgi:hypothetical protein